MLIRVLYLMSLFTFCKSLSRQLFEENKNIADQSLNGVFVQQIANGSLPNHSFQKYLQQDNLYLSKYARAVSRVASTSSDDGEFVFFTNLTLNYLFEHNHSAYRTVASFDKDATPTTIAYTSFLSQAALAGDRLYLMAAILPCQKLYDYIFTTLAKQGSASGSNPYKSVIDQYASPNNHNVTEQMERYLDKEVGYGLTNEKFEQAKFYYATALRFEAEFFAQALDGWAISMV